MERDTHSENPLKPSCIMCSVGCIVDNAKGHCISNLQIRLKCLVVMSERVHLFQRPHFLPTLVNLFVASPFEPLL